SSTAISDLTATATGDLTVNGTDIGALAAAGTTQERTAQVVDAINRVSTTTNVGAFFDATNNKIVLTSAGNITLTGAAGAKTDFAAETASMTRSQILQQAGNAMLSQANQLPQQVLALLR